MLFFFVVINTLGHTVSGKHPHVDRSTLDIIRMNGYPTETHYVLTEDGYILSLYRIPHGLTNTTRNGPPVLLMHGIVQSSADYVLMGPEKSIGFILADLGYDVWLGNARGNLYSRNHTVLDPDQSKFWEFSWHEIGYYDLSAKIRYILRTTGYNKLHYIGHSQGSTAILVLLSSRPTYNDKVNLVVLLAPCSYMENVINPFIYAVVKYKISAIIYKILSFFTHGEFLRHSELISKTAQTLCSETSIFREICATLLFCVVGFSYRLMDYTLLPAMLTNSPAGASSMQLMHYSQSMESGKFRRFDHGVMNIIRYGQVTPPEYSLWKITAPVAIFYSDYDWICCTKDIERLYSELPNSVYMKKITEAIFNHMDFIWSSNDIIQQYIIYVMSKY